MSSVAIDRPMIGYDDAAHAYTIDGTPVPGVSSVAKIGGDSWGPASWWGWGIALAGVAELAAESSLAGWSVEDLRDTLKAERVTPNAKRDAAGERGNAVHDALEKLAQDGDVPDPSRYPAAERGHVRSLIRWWLRYRPEFVATEVMVGSRQHMYAGRYDIRARIEGFGLCLIDLKTSKGIYPDTHFPQLEGYELASVEMGFPATDGRWMLRTREDGEFVAHDDVPAHKWEDSCFVKSWGTADTFLGYLSAYRARQALHDGDPAIAWRAAARVIMLAALEDGPALSRDVAKTCGAIELGLDSRTTGRLFGQLRDDGLVKQGKAKRWELIA